MRGTAMNRFLPVQIPIFFQYTRSAPPLTRQTCILCTNTQYRAQKEGAVAVTKPISHSSVAECFLYSSLSLRERGTASAVERVSKVGHSSIYKNFDVPSTPSQSPVGASSPGGRACCMSDVQQFYGTVPVTATAPVFMINISS